MQVRPLEHELHREVGPRLAAVTGHELELGEEPADLVDQADFLGRERHPGPGHARAHADRDVELNALRVDRIELLVVDRDLGAEPRGERGGRLHAELLDRGLELADRLHALVRVHLVAPEEAVRVVLDRLLGLVVLEARPDHRHRHPVLVHLGQQVADGVVHVLLEVGHVLEHVLRRELEVFARLTVQELGAEEVVPALGIPARDSQHQVDDPDIGRHRHEIDAIPPPDAPSDAGSARSRRGPSGDSRANNKRKQTIPGPRRSPSPTGRARPTGGRRDRRRPGVRVRGSFEPAVGPLRAAPAERHCDFARERWRAFRGRHRRVVGTFGCSCPWVRCGCRLRLPRLRVARPAPVRSRPVAARRRASGVPSPSPVPPRGHRRRAAGVGTASVTDAPRVQRRAVPRTEERQAGGTSSGDSVSAVASGVVYIGGETTPLRVDASTVQAVDCADWRELRSRLPSPSASLFADSERPQSVAFDAAGSTNVQ